MRHHMFKEALVPGPKQFSSAMRRNVVRRTMEEGRRGEIDPQVVKKIVDRWRRYTSPTGSILQKRAAIIPPAGRIVLLGIGGGALAGGSIGSQIGVLRSDNDRVGSMARRGALKGAIIGGFLGGGATLGGIHRKRVLMRNIEAARPGAGEALSNMANQAKAFLFKRAFVSGLGKSLMRGGVNHRLGRTMLRYGGMGASVGAVAGAASANPGNRLKGALTGGAIGGAIGAGYKGAKPMYSGAKKLFSGVPMAKAPIVKAQKL